jgi:hypothetical protein
LQEKQSKPGGPRPRRKTKSLEVRRIGENGFSNYS